MNLLDRFVLFYASLVRLLINWMLRKRVPSFLVEIVCHMVFLVFFYRLEYKILLRSSAR